MRRRSHLATGAANHEHGYLVQLGDLLPDGVTWLCDALYHAGHTRANARGHTTGTPVAFA